MKKVFILILSIVLSKGISQYPLFSEHKTILKTDAIDINDIYIYKDINGDGLIDFAGTGGSKQLIYLSEGNTYTKHNINSTRHLLPVSFVDFNKDGKDDIMTESYDCFINKGNGNFESLNLEIGNSAYDFKCYNDLDKDGSIDIVCNGAMAFENEELMVYFNDGNNKYTKVVLDNTIKTFGYVQVMDYDGDGISDVLVINNDNVKKNFMIFKNLGNRQFQKTEFSFESKYNVEQECFQMNDLDKDGDKDLLFTASNDLFILKNDNNTFNNYINLTNTALRNYYFFKLVDIDIDGDEDIISLSQGLYSTALRLDFFINNGNMNFSGPNFIDGGYGWQVFGWSNYNYFENIFGILDYNNDQKPDIIYNSPNTGEMLWYKNLTTDTLHLEIVVHPVGASVCKGSQVKFNVVSSGANLIYQWQKDEKDITGANQNELILNNILESDAGYYRCIVRSGSDVEISNAALLKFERDVEITDQPQSLNLKLGDTAVFSVDGNGSVIYFQWFKDDNYLDDDLHISGAYSAQLTISNIKASDKGSYYCEIKGKCNTVYSETVHLDITSKVIDIQDTGIIISPNPTTDLIHISTLKYPVDLVEVYDIREQKLLQQVPDARTVDVSSLSSGLYIVKIYSGQDVIVGKVVVE